MPLSSIDTDPQVGVAGDNAVHDEVGDGDCGRESTAKIESSGRHEGSGSSVYEPSRRRVLIADVERGRDPVLDERRPASARGRDATAVPVDRRGRRSSPCRTSAASNAATLCFRTTPDPAASGARRGAAALPLGRHDRAPPVPRAHVGGERGTTSTVRAPQQPEVREQHRFVEPHGVEARQPRRWFPVVGGQRLVVASTRAAARRGDASRCRPTSWCHAGLHVGELQLWSRQHTHE